MSSIGGVWYSPATGAVAQEQTNGVAVHAPGLAATLSGVFASEFLSRFQGESSSTPRLEALARLGSQVHRDLLSLAASGDAAAWRPLTAMTRYPTLFLELLGRCNERCVHCYAESAPEVRDELSRETAEKTLREARALGFEWVQFTGGDPLLCSFVVELAELAEKLGFPFREVYTNGLGLTEAKADGLARAGVRFAFSFYSANAARHDALTRTPGSQQRTLQAIQRALARKCPVRVGMVDFGDGPEALKSTRQLLIDTGVDPSLINVDTVRLVGRGQETPSSSDAEGTTARHTGSERDDAAVWPGKLCVSYTGTVYPCIFARGMGLGNVTRQSLMDIVESARTARLDPKVTAAGAQLACHDCRLTALALTQSA